MLKSLLQILIPSAGSINRLCGLHFTSAVTLCQVHVVAAVNSVCLGAATTLTQTLRSTLSSTKESLYEAWIVIAIAPLQHTLPKIGSDSVKRYGPGTRSRDYNLQQKGPALWPVPYYSSPNCCKHNEDMGSLERQQHRSTAVTQLFCPLFHKQLLILDAAILLTVSRRDWHEANRQQIAER